jgi:hypothetical protein
MFGRDLKERQQARGSWFYYSWRWQIRDCGQLEIPLAGWIDARTDDSAQ